MTTAIFTDSTTINVVVSDGEKFVLKNHFPIQVNEQQQYADLLTKYFEENFSNDKSSMVYWVLMKMMGNHGLSFYQESSDRSIERERIGAKIRSLREAKGMEAKQLAIITNIDAANISRIEQGRYSVGLDILAKIAHALGVKVDFIDL
jgi:DNA-binding XRE family transcriptional regulator